MYMRLVEKKEDINCAYVYDCGLKKDKCRDEVCDFMIGIQQFYYRLGKELSPDERRDYLIKKK